MKDHCGTPNYVSPEVVKNKEYGLKTDVWSVGCALYYMLVGQPPFEHDNVRMTYRNVLSMKYYLPNSLS